MSRNRHGRVESHRNRWRFQVYVNGERIRRSFATRQEAEQALEQLLDKLDADGESALARRLGIPTVADVVREYYERRKPHLELSTQARYEAVLRKYVLPRIGQIDAREIAVAPVLLQDFLDSIPWGQARKALEVLGPAFRMACDNGLIPCNPVPKIGRPRPPERRRKKEIPTPEEVEKTIIAAYEEDDRWGYFVELVATLGLRRAEACALRWEDFEFPRSVDTYGRVHVRRAVGKRAGGIYIKPPKSGLERELLAAPSLFAGLGRYRKANGWLFPGRETQPADERLILFLFREGGVIECPSGRAGARARRAIGTNSATFSLTVRPLVDRGLVTRDSNPRRTFRLELTEAGFAAAGRLANRKGEANLPVHPDTMGHRFEAMVLGLGLRGPSGRLYTLHSLRHFRATHLYNASKDWVQVAKYLGHTSPAITMELYANNVVSATQELLARTSARRRIPGE